MQTKETLTLKASSFGSKCELSTKFMDSVGKSGVADNVLAFSKFKENRALQKTDGTKKTRVTGAALCILLHGTMGFNSCLHLRCLPKKMGHRCFQSLPYPA